MKRAMACVLLICLLIAALPAFAAKEITSDMMVTGCEEWVSMREKPKKSAARVLKVSLGAVVRNCRAHSKEWVYAEYDGHAGYILAQYLESCEDRLHSAMVVSGCPDGAGLYSPIDAVTTDVVIPEGALVRNCSIQNEEQIYVEYAGQCGFVDAACLHPYNAFGTRWNYPSPMFFTTDFTPPDDGHKPRVYAQWGRQAEERMVFLPRKNVTDFQVLSLSFADMDEYGYLTFEAEVIHMQEELTPENPAMVEMLFVGDMPEYAISYTDEDGITRFFTVELSGRDGSIVMQEF